MACQADRPKWTTLMAGNDAKIVRAKRWGHWFVQDHSDGTVQRAGCRVYGAGCRVKCVECRMNGVGCRVQGAGCREQGAGCRV